MASIYRIRFCLGLGLTLLPGAVCAQMAVSADVPADLPPELAALLSDQTVWSSTATLQSAIGYKDNLLLSRYQPASSGFARAGAEIFLWRLPQGRADWVAFANAEGTRYFDRRAVQQEAQAFLHGEWRYRIGEVFNFSFEGQGYYLDQVFDVSDTDVQRTVAQLKVTGAALGPKLHWAPVTWGWVEARGTAKRETYRDGQNNSRYYEGEFRLGWRPGARFEASLAAIERRRDFDHREQYSEGGHQQPGTILQTTEQEVEGKINVTLDQAAQWKTVTHAGTVRYADNGSGYFSYREAKLAQELEWTAGDWLVQGEASAKRLVYNVQTVGLGIAPAARLKESYAAELRVERKLNARWTVYAEYTWERNRSNYVLAGYRMNECLLGLQWNWEKGRSAL